MIKRWHSLGVREKLHILIQGAFMILFLISVSWVTGRFEDQIMESVEARAMETADGLINGMNMLMLTGTINNPDNRRLLLKKMSESRGIRELRIIRAKQVQDQYGPGLPEEQAVDDIDRRVIATGKVEFERIKADGGASTLRVVVPYIAKENFRGTDCLACHQVRPDSVNGAASVVMDLSEEEAHVANLKKWLWLWFIAAQAVLSVIIALFVRFVIVKHITLPVHKLRKTMSAIKRDGDLSRRAEVDKDNADIGEMAQTFNRFTESLMNANKRLDLFARVFENSGEAVIITDAERNFVVVNRAFTTITGYEPEEVLGRNPKMLSSGRQSPEFYQAMWRSINETGYWQGEIWNRRKTGEIYPQWLSIGTVKDDKGVVVNYISIFNDITQRKEAEQHIQFLAHYDSLTKLPNRRLFEDRIRQALASSNRMDRKAALLFLDLDRFKSINDTLGHLSGDLLLQSVADRLRSCVRETDTVCRQGGDEFMILLSEISKPEDAAHIATKIIAAMSEAHCIDDYQLMVTFSIGISMYPDDGVDSQTLVRNADAAMYRAKEQGRNNFKFFTPDMNAEASERLTLEADLRQALQREELSLYYQPQVDNRSGQIIGIEALVRWQHTEKCWISPSRFIPIAEECGLINLLGDWVLRTACIQNRRWQDEGLLKVPIAVNLSALQFNQKDIKATITRVLRESGLESEYLELEITESTAMKDFELTIRTLNEIKQMGVLVSIDDFGTGYSSLSYLKRFPMDKLKIDQSFVRDITSNADDAAIVQIIIGIGHILRLRVIAEGVETADQHIFLKNNGCDETQGYYFSKPLSAEDFGKFVKSYVPAKSISRPRLAFDNSRPTDITEIDRQHQGLLDIVNRMDESIRDNASTEVLARVLDDLISHTQDHFATEEHLMSQSGYPDERLHRKEHQILLEEVHSIRKRLGNEAEHRVLQATNHWLLAHMEKADSRLAHYMGESQVAVG